MITITRLHDFSYGHRVCGHEGQCAHLHGHNGRVSFTCVGGSSLDPLGRVVDFSVIKSRLCQWLEDHWDHRMLMWERDPWLPMVRDIDETVVALGFNPTAEQLAAYLLNVVGPVVLSDTGVQLIRVQFDETRKCSATVER